MPYRRHRDAGAPSNNALEWAATGLQWRAAGALEIVAPAAHGSVFPRPAQRGR